MADPFAAERVVLFEGVGAQVLPPERRTALVTELLDAGYDIYGLKQDPNGGTAASIELEKLGPLETGGPATEKAPKNTKVVTKPVLTKPVIGSLVIVDDTVAFGANNYPNPFNPYTIIEYGIPEASRVRLIVYNVLGQEVRVLEDGYMDAGKYAVRWDGRDEIGRSVSSGTYIYRLQAGPRVAIGRMQFVK